MRTGGKETYNEAPIPRTSKIFSTGRIRLPN